MGSDTGRLGTLPLPSLCSCTMRVLPPDKSTDFAVGNFRAAARGWLVRLAQVGEVRAQQGGG